jgi:hypothetical protein
MRRTAATELALSPCTHRVLACKRKALPSLAVRGSPRAMISACSMTSPGRDAPRPAVAATPASGAVVGAVGEGFEPQGHAIFIAQGWAALLSRVAISINGKLRS